MTRQETIEKATSWMEKTAKDNSHGYDQIYRWGEKGDYDCSAAVITAWVKAGVNLKDDGASYTGNLVQALKKNGFKEITTDVDFKTGNGLKRGDILFAKGHHTAMYCGNGKEVEASINEKGKATGGKPGDQTGREFLIRSYRNYPWTNAYRYVGVKSEEKKETIVTVTKKAKEPRPIYRVKASSGLNLRRLPSGTSEIMRILKDKTALYDDPSREKSGNWVPVIYIVGSSKFKGYVSGNYIEKV